VLLRREVQVGDWSLDHLLVDQRGVLTFVEAKLLQNPEARRAVVGQILDYAAYAAENWKNGRLKQLAADYWRQKNGDVDEALRNEFGAEFDTELFWSRVEENLAQANIRLIVVADELRPEVRRVIEFLNQQMRTIQVFGLEIRCFGEGGNTVVVPYLIGQTQAIAKQKALSAEQGRDWKVEELRSAYSELSDSALRDRLVALLNWAVERNCIEPGRGTQNPVFALVGHSGRWIVSVAPRWIYPRLQEMRWADESQRNSFVADLKGIDLYPTDFDPASTKDVKNTRKHEEWSDEQFQAFLNVLTKYCGRRSAAVGRN
jgi:hypothetical protein